MSIGREDFLLLRDDPNLAIFRRAGLLSPVARAGKLVTPHFGLQRRLDDFMER
jgi:hypothetical protein